MTTFARLAITGVTLLVACSLVELITTKGTPVRRVLPWVAWPSAGVVLVGFLGHIWTS